MDFEEYRPFCNTDKQVDVLRAYCETGGSGKAAAVLGIRDDSYVRRTIRQIRQRHADSVGPESVPSKSVPVEKRKRYVVTAAQNVTRLHLPFYRALLNYCEEHDAQLIVIPLRYRNPTTPKESPDDWYDERVAKHLVGERTELVPGLMLMSDIKIQPTAVTPLTGLQTITGQKCGIFGHTRVAMESIPTPGTDIPKLLYTTGAVTRANYSDSKAGKKGEFHHVLGAVVVQQDGDIFHLRHISANSSGAFHDLDKRYTQHGVENAKRPASFVMGDLHAMRHDPPCLSACHHILDNLKPRRVILHDVLDFHSASHHNDYFERFQLRQKGRDNVMEELMMTCEIVDEIAGKAQAYVVSSNHDQHLYKWLERHDNGLDVQNALIYHKIKYNMLQEISEGKPIPDPLELVARDHTKHKIRFLRGESFQVHGVEFTYHGDRGPNGARGSIKSFDKIGPKSTIGHGHGPGINGGCHQVGTSSNLNLGYNHGAPSNWLHSHSLQYADGKRTHIHVINGRCGV